MQVIADDEVEMGWAKLLVGGLCAASLSACATRPEVVTRYYPAKATAKVEVTQSVTCAGQAPNRRIIYATSPTVTVTYAADKSVTPHEFSSSGLGGAFANTDLGWEFFPDGRLKGLNWTSTGKGDEAVKAAIALGKAAVSVAFVDPCAVVDREGGKPLTLSYQTIVPLAGPGRHEVPATLSSRPARDSIGEALPKIWLVVGDQKVRARSAEVGRYRPNGAVLLPLNDIAAVELQVELESSQGAETIWSESADVPVSSTYKLAIPKAAVFGKTTFKLGLNESGSISTISYGSESGAASAMGAGAVILAEFKEDDLVKQVADTKAKADLIAQQQRLLRCEASRESCT